MREKISISLSSAVLKQIDNLINNVNIRNRSQAFEHVAREFIKNRKTAQALILLGGRNQKINLTNLKNQLKSLAKHGITEVHISAGEKNNLLFNKVGTNFENRVNINYIVEENPLGTAGAIKSAEKNINSTFITMWGDIKSDIDIGKLIEFHKEKNSVATVCLKPVEKKLSTDNILVEGDKIISFEYQTGAKTHLTNAGIYIFEPSIFKELPKKGSLEKDVLPKLAFEGKLLSYILSKEWVHIS